MKEIKTIQKRRDYFREFDAEVNKALADGWRLVGRFIATGFDGTSLCFYPMHVAYLEKEVDLNG